LRWQKVFRRCFFRPAGGRAFLLGTWSDSWLRDIAVRSKLTVIIGVLIFAGLVVFGVYRQEFGEVLLNATLL